MLSCGNRNLKDMVVRVIPDYQLKKRYKVIGEYDSEGSVMYFDMCTAVESSFRVTNRQAIRLCRIAWLFQRFGLSIAPECRKTATPGEYLIWLLFLLPA